MGRILSPPGSGPELVAEADAQPARHRSAPQFPTHLNICHQLWHGHLVLTPVGQDRQGGLKHWQSVARPIINIDDGVVRSLRHSELRAVLEDDHVWHELRCVLAFLEVPDGTMRVDKLVVVPTSNPGR